MKKLYTNGLVWQESGFTKLDIIVENGIIVNLGQNLFEPYLDVIDCQGTYILPGIIDMHVHVGEKICGLDLADDFSSLNQLANLSGISALGVFITEAAATEHNPKPLLQQYERITELAKREFEHSIHWHLTPITSDPEDIVPLIRSGCDLKFYTTYRPNGLYRSYDEISRWMQDLKDIKPRILVHCEDDEVVGAMSAFHPFNHPYDSTKRRPEVAEIRAVEKVLDLAVKHNYPLHIVHVSTPGAAMLIYEARKLAPITCETAPQYLLLNEECLKREDGHRWLCTPPLRNEHSRGLMVELLQDGVFDAIATDHCPYKKADKDLYQDNPEQVPVGIAGLGATIPLMYEHLVKTGKLTLEKLMLYISTNPARLMNFYPAQGTIQTGASAKLIMLRITPDNISSPILPSLGDTYNPWEGMVTDMKIKVL
jgi:dihydropyrimidinase